MSWVTIVELERDKGPAEQGSCLDPKMNIDGRVLHDSGEEYPRDHSGALPERFVMSAIYVSGRQRRQAHQVW